MTTNIKNIAMLTTALVVCGAYAKKGTAIEQLSLDAVNTTMKKIAVVDLFGCMGVTEHGKHAKGIVDKHQAELTGRVSEQQKAFQQRVKEFEDKKDLLSQEARNKEEQELLTLQSDLQHEAQKAEQELRSVMNAQSEDLAADAEEAAIELAKQQDLDLLLEKTTGRVIYCKADYELTETVVTRMNDGWQKRLAQKEAEEKTEKVAQTTTTTDKTKATS